MGETLIRLRDDAPSAAPVVAFADLANAGNAVAVRLSPGDDARALLPLLGQLELVEIAFPSFGDGRGYSAAAILREYGYSGELRATGDVLIDEVSHYHRTGFDAFLPDQLMTRAEVDKAIATWPHVYQRTADGRVPIWALRHG